MVWSLEIHHIDVGQGDSTLFVARNDGVGPDQVEQVRSVLIDGGHEGEGGTVHRYITNPRPGGAGLNALDVMVATHYDVDHMNGLRAVLELNAATYDNTLIYDQGEPGTISAKYARGAGGRFLNVTYDNREPSYTRYLNAISRRGNRRRVTARVYQKAENTMHEQNLDNEGWEGGTWLLEKEIMWANADGEAVTPASLLNPARPDNVNQNPPTIKCIAVNQHIMGYGGPYVSGDKVDPKNEKSLAFIVKFNNFKYYIGGDIESKQEDVLMRGLNYTNTPADRVLAMKVSHHGSERSTNAAFLQRLMPVAAFISCGIDNAHDHPRERVLNDLQASSIVSYYLTEDRKTAQYRERVGYIQDDDRTNALGNNSEGEIDTIYTGKAYVAGGRGAPFFMNPPDVYHGDLAPHRIWGHVVLHVTEDESRQSVVNPQGTRFRVRLYEATAVFADYVEHSF